MKFIVNKGKFTLGVVLMLSFLAALIVIVSPVIRGQTGLQYADNLFNELTKQSSYYIPDIAKKASKFNGERFEVDVKAKSRDEAEMIAKICRTVGASAAVGRNSVTVCGDLGNTADAALKDADLVFNGQDSGIRAKYGCDGKTAIRCWWLVFSAEQKRSFRNGKYAEALFLKSVVVRALEPAHNFVGIKSARISERIGIVIFLLAFYIVYTIWWGVGVMCLFDGLGLTTSRSAEKKEA